MTKEEKIIATAFTGKMFIDGSEMGSLYEYMEKKVGYGVIDIMLASKEFWEELHRACEQDFIDMVSKEQPSLPSNLDEAELKYVEFSDYPPANQEEELMVYNAFKAGAEWMAGQGVTKEAVIGIATEKIIINVSPQTLNGLDLCPDDKVVVQIRKK